MGVAVGVEIESEGRETPVEVGAAVAHSLTCIWHREYKIRQVPFFSLRWSGGCVTQVYSQILIARDKCSTVSQELE